MLFRSVFRWVPLPRVCPLLLLCWVPLPRVPLGSVAPCVSVIIVVLGSVAVRNGAARHTYSTSQTAAYYANPLTIFGLFFGFEL